MVSEALQYVKQITVTLKFLNRDATTEELAQLTKINNVVLTRRILNEMKRQGIVTEDKDGAYTYWYLTPRAEELLGSKGL